MPVSRGPSPGKGKGAGRGTSMRRFAVSVLFAALTCGAFVSAGGQGQQESGTLQVLKSFQTARGVKDSTARYQPQIDDAKGPSREYPENPAPPIILSTSPSTATAPHGTAGTSPRVQPEARFPGIGATGWVPPDPNIAVGPSHVVEVVNSDVAFFDKNTGQKTFQQGMDGASGWFGSVGATDFVFDPKCYYDKTSGRFFVLALELADPGISKLLIAVSDDSNPTGNWYKYRIEAMLTVGSNTYWMDYPSLGVNKDGVAVCGNMFAMSGSSGWGGVEFVVMKKAPMLTGQPTTVSVLRDPNAGSAQVAQMQDSVVDKIYGAAAISTNALRVYAITSITATPAISFSQVAVPTFFPRNRPSYSTNGRYLDNIDSRLYNCAWKGGRLVTTHHVQVSGSDDRSNCRWYSITTNNWPSTPQTPILEQSGDVYGAAGQDYHFPSINVNAYGDIGMTFCRSSNAITADVMVVARRSTDALGTMGAPTLMRPSSDPNYGYAGTNRWGDFYSTQIDPTDDRIMWGVGMTSEAGGNWGTHIVKWQVGSFENSATPFDALTATMYDGTSSNGTVASVWAVDFNLFTVVSRFIQSMGHVAGVQTTYQIDQPASTVNGLGVKVTAKASVPTTGMIWLWNWNTSKYEHVKSFKMATNTYTTQTISATGDLTRFVNASKQVKGVFRANNTVRNAKPFVLTVELQQLLITYAPGG